MTMRVCVRLDGAHPRRWHLRLLERLAGMPGLAVSVAADPASGGLPAGAALLFRLEALLRGLPGDGPSTSVAAATLPALATAQCPDLILDLCGDAVALPGTRVWRLAFDGAPGEAALLASLFAGRTPVATLHEDERLVASAHLGTEARGVMLTSFEDALVRTTTLVLMAFAGGGPSVASRIGPEAPPPMPSGRDFSARALRLLARAVARRLYHLCYLSPHWRVAWRPLTGPDLLSLRAHPSGGWRDLPDDGLRYYADPFPIHHDGGTVLFVEEYAHALGKGVIAAVRFGPDGPLGTPRPVLEADHHLSYPFVFARDGAHWMIPESGGNRSVDLYRATAFPGGWVKEATLLSGVTASDATLVEHEGRWWMFATIRDDAAAFGPQGRWGSYSDCLHLWSAPDFRGPWTPHPRNPVLIDIAAARSAGRIVARGGALIRPVQDCRLGYGEALALARIERLDDDGYGQVVETILRGGPNFPASGLHTLNRAGGFEFIDGMGRVRRRWRAARG